MASSKEYMAEWRRLNKEKNAEYQRRWRKRHPTTLKAARSAQLERYRAMTPQQRRAATEGNYFASLMRKYGMTRESYERMLKKQKGLCALCRKPSPTRRMSVDHCHDTGVVRKLLCMMCNVALGHFRDDPATLKRAVRYLTSHGAKPASRRR